MSYFPLLGSDPEMRTGRLRFTDWWQKRLLARPDSGVRWRGRDFVLGGANIEQGAHVDPEPDAWWTDLRNGAPGWAPAW